MKEWWSICFYVINAQRGEGWTLDQRKMNHLYMGMFPGVSEEFIRNTSALCPCLALSAQSHLNVNSHRNALLLWHRPSLSLNLYSNPRGVRKLAQLNGTKTRRWEKWKQMVSSGLLPTEDPSWGRKDNLNNLKLWLWNGIRYFLISKLKFNKY